MHVSVRLEWNQMTWNVLKKVITSMHLMTAFCIAYMIAGYYNGVTMVIVCKKALFVFD